MKMKISPYKSQLTLGWSGIGGYARGRGACAEHRFSHDLRQRAHVVGRCGLSRFFCYFLARITNFTVGYPTALQIVHF